MQASGAECVPCHGADYVTLALLPLLVLVISGAGHIILAMQSRATGSQFGALLTAALCLNQLVTTAQLFSVMEQVQGIVWEEPFVNFLKVFRVLSLDALLGSVDVFGCVARIGPENLRTAGLRCATFRCHRTLRGACRHPKAKKLSDKRSFEDTGILDPTLLYLFVLRFLGTVPLHAAPEWLENFAGG